MILLDRSTAPRTVRTGAYGVFAARPEGRPQFLFEVGPSEVLVGTEVAGWTLHASPLEPSTSDETADASTAPWEERLRTLAGLAPETPLARGLGQWLDEQDRGRQEARHGSRAERERHLEAERARREGAAAVDPRSALAHPSPLVRAAALVGQELGLVVRAPSDGDDLDRARHPMEAVARASRCRAREVDLAGTWWTEVGAPLVATRTDGRPVALLRTADRAGYRMVDPDEPEPVVVDGTVADGLEPRAWELYRPLPDRPLGLWELLRFALTGRGPELARALGWGLGLALAGMAVPVATGLLIDSVIPSSDRGMLAILGAGLIALAAGRFAFELAQGAALVRLDSTAEFVAQAAMWDRLLRLRVGFFRSYPVGDLLERVSSVRTISQRLTGATLKTALGGVLSVLNLGLLVFYSPPLAAVAALIGLSVALATLIPAARVVALNHQLAHHRGRLMARTIEQIRGMAKIRAAGAQEWAFLQWLDRYRHTLALSSRIWQLQDGVAVVQVAVGLGSTLVLYALAVSPLASGLSAGDLLAFLAAFGAFQGGLAAVAETVVDVADVVALGDRARPILDAPPEVSQDRVTPGRLRGGVAVDRVRFRYREGGPPVLADVSLRIEPGELVAIVGPSGAGKSTLLRMLLGFDEPRSGRVLYDGQDLAGLDLDGVRRQIGVVLQSEHALGGSILELLAGARRIDLDEAWAALEAAGLADEVRAMPMGLHSMVTDGGSTLSGGQRQRLLIARALVARPALLFFDEATSALDNRTQQLVTESLERLGVSRLVIAHRLSTIRNADRIYVLEAGSVVQEGRFDELVDRPGRFAELVARQRHSDNVSWPE